MTDEPDHAAVGDVRDRQRQIAADLRHQILTGEFKPGDKAPSTAQLCERYGVSNLTTQRALAILKKQGFVRGESGVGVFVTANQPIVVEANHYPGQTSSATPYPWISEIASHGRRKTSHLLSVDEVTPPVAVAAAYDIEPDTRVIRRRLLLLLDDVEATMPTIDEFIALEMPDDMPVLRQFRIIYTTDGEPIEVTEMIKAAHRHKARYLLPGPQEG